MTRVGSFEPFVFKRPGECGTLSTLVSWIKDLEYSPAYLSRQDKHRERVIRSGLKASAGTTQGTMGSYGKADQSLYEAVHIPQMALPRWAGGACDPSPNASKGGMQHCVPSPRGTRPRSCTVRAYTHEP